MLRLVAGQPLGDDVGRVVQRPGAVGARVGVRREPGGAKVEGGVVVEAGEEEEVLLEARGGWCWCVGAGGGGGGL